MTRLLKATACAAALIATGAGGALAQTAGKTGAGSSEYAPGHQNFKNSGGSGASDYAPGHNKTNGNARATAPGHQRVAPRGTGSGASGASSGSTGVGTSAPGAEPNAGASGSSRGAGGATGR